ncbi:MAG: hypothetical protein HWE39_15960 [Oceanospirillaceae bacterium]|nr:hypothetical protein [Oceanospirillaceae bacterium]
MTSLLVACGSSSNDTSEPQPKVPDSRVNNVTFYDQDLRFGYINGQIQWQVAQEENVAGYRVYLKQGDDSLTAIANISDVAQTQIELNSASECNDCSAIEIYSYNATGQALTGASVAIQDRGLPTGLASDLAFVDQSPNPNLLSGSLTFDNPQDIRGISYFSIYRINANGEKLSAALNAIDFTESGNYTISVKDSEYTQGDGFAVYSGNIDGESEHAQTIFPFNLKEVASVNYRKVESSDWTQLSKNGDTIELPFPVFVFNTMHTSIAMCSSNGIIFFESNSIDCYNSSIEDFIEGYSDSLDPGVTYLSPTGYNMFWDFDHKFEYAVIGESPHREFVINVQPRADMENITDGSAYAFYQVIFIENGAIEIHSENMDLNNQDYAAHQQRLENADRSQALFYEGDERGSRWKFEYALQEDGIQFNSNAYLGLPDARIEYLEYLASGKICWTRPNDESSINGYLLKFLDNNKDEIATWDTILPVNDSEIAIGASDIPEDTYYLRVVSFNTSGESTEFYDYVFAPQVPNDTVTQLAFTDIHGSENKIYGDLSWLLPEDESQIQGYHIYRGTSITNYEAQPLTSVSKGTTGITLQFDHDSINDHLIVVAYNLKGDAQTAAAIEFSDKVAQPVENLQFTDTDPDQNEYAGVITWDAPTDNNDTTTYHVRVSNATGYWMRELGSVEAGQPMQFSIDENTAIDYAYIMIYSTVGSAYGHAFVSIPVVDLTQP